MFNEQRRLAGTNQLRVTAGTDRDGESEPEHAEQLDAGAQLGERPSVLQQPGGAHLQKRKANFVRVRGQI